jgi:L,D-transpeptidase YbiS
MAKPAKIALGIGIGAVLIVLGLIVAGSLIAKSWGRNPVPAVPESKPARPVKAAPLKPEQWEARIKSLNPRGIYVMIDTAENRLRILRDGKLIQEAVVSCGSGDILEDIDGKRTWIFETPRGEFSVSSKLVNPTWIKPDWAFIEEGEKVPTDYNERIDNDTLGDYALGFGDGFFIHGTLYSRLLGRNVTHGCVRVGDKDLKSVFQSVPMGAKIYIY